MSYPNEYIEDSYDDTEEYFEEEEADMRVKDAASVKDGEKEINKSNFEKTQRAIIDTDFIGTLEGWGNGQSDTVFALGPHLHKHFKQLVGKKNRANATEEEMEGNPDRILILGMQLLEKQNTSSVFMNINCPNVVPTTFSAYGRHTIRLQPFIHSPMVPAEKDIFVPSNPVTKWMYLSGTIATPEMVTECIDEKDDHALIRVCAPGSKDMPSLPYDCLVYNLNEENAWRDVDMNRRDINDAIHDGRNWVEVPLVVARDVKRTLLGPINDLLKSCISVKDLKFTLTRGDGEDMNSFKNIPGELVGIELEEDGNNVLKDAPIITRNVVHAKIGLDFVTMS